MRLGTIAFLFGIVASYSAATSLDRCWVAALPLAVVAIARVPRLRLPACFVAGFLWALMGGGDGTVARLPHSLESVDLRAQGWIASIPKVVARGIRFQLELENISQGGEITSVRGRAQLTWYGKPPPVRVGDKWEVTVRLRRPHGWANPGAFDYERWLFAQGIIASGYVRATPAARLLGRAVRYPVDRFRQSVAERFSRLLGTNPHAATLAALAVGERGRIDAAQWEVFTRTGTTHLMAISGLHIGLVAGFAFLIIRRVWAWFPALLRRVPATTAAAVAGLLSAGGYALLAGLSIPTQRSFVMVAVAMMASMSQRCVHPSHALALALLAVLVVDPAAPLSPGFWLSFAAVAVILYSVVGRGHAQRPLRGWVFLQLAVTLALAPVTLALFHSASLLSPAANLIAIPWISVTVVPLTLLAVLAGFINETAQTGVLEAAALAMEWLWRFLSALARQHWAMVHLSAPPIWALLAAIPGVALLLAPKGIPARWVGGVIILPLVLTVPASPAPGSALVTLLDVGPGLAVVIRTARHVLIYDTGPRVSPSLDAGRAALVPFMRQDGMASIDTLIVSHADQAHTGGVRSLLEHVTVERVLTSSPLQVPIEGALPCRAGMSWTWDKVRFELLHPPPGGGLAGDDASCVLLVEAAGTRILLPGDIGPAAQAALVASATGSLAANILVAPYDGKRDLSSPAFIAAVDPDYVLFSSAWGSRPSAAQSAGVERHPRAAARLLDTTDLGAISFHLEPGKPVLPMGLRESRRRRWRTR